MSWNGERESDVVQELLKYSSDKAYGRKGTGLETGLLFAFDWLVLEEGRVWNGSWRTVSVEGRHRLALRMGRGISTLAGILFKPSAVARRWLLSMAGSRTAASEGWGRVRNPAHAGSWVGKGQSDQALPT